ncbi:hypothetical protein QTO34_014944 [Cnephaeus nilssonii]|uniref:Uncharacterized protein n=1 Tax=Cnephaeus nilssonii TaxID=3371016 RepID=A0AA40I7B6_CNENI|nr:hypothetical protein QTO34_014944 [Eptesicus nilssonii]
MRGARLSRDAGWNNFCGNTHEVGPSWSCRPRRAGVASWTGGCRLPREARCPAAVRTVRAAPSAVTRVEHANRLVTCGLCPRARPPCGAGPRPHLVHRRSPGSQGPNKRGARGGGALWLMNGGVDVSGSQFRAHIAVSASDDESEPVAVVAQWPGAASCGQGQRQAPLGNLFTHLRPNRDAAQRSAPRLPGPGSASCPLRPRGRGPPPGCLPWSRARNGPRSPCVRQAAPSPLSPANGSGRGGLGPETHRHTWTLPRGRWPICAAACAAPDTQRHGTAMANSSNASAPSYG